MSRLAGMLFSRPLVVDSSLTPNHTRARIRAFSTSRDVPNLEAFRRRQIVSWRLSRANEDFVFQPEYGDALEIEGACFLALVEPAGSESRVRGRVTVAPLTRLVMSILMFAVVLVAAGALAQGREPAPEVLTIASSLLGGMRLVLHFCVGSACRLVEARLRQALEEPESRAVA